MGLVVYRSVLYMDKIIILALLFSTCLLTWLIGLLARMKRAE